MFALLLQTVPCQQLKHLDYLSLTISRWGNADCNCCRPLSPGIGISLGGKEDVNFKQKMSSLWILGNFSWTRRNTLSLKIEIQSSFGELLSLNKKLSCPQQTGDQKLILFSISTGWSWRILLLWVCTSPARSESAWSIIVLVKFQGISPFPQLAVTHEFSLSMYYWWNTTLW